MSKKTAMEWINLITGMDKVPEKINVICGALTTILSGIFGQEWRLFAGFLILNFADYITGWIKSKYYTRTESSKVGAKGIIKKVGYWVVILVAFFVANELERVGEIIGVNLGFVVLLGYLTLATYIINEIRSILENLTEMNVNVPEFLVQGLQVASKKVDTIAEIKKAEEKTNADK